MKEWELVDGKLCKTYRFVNFIAAISFMAKAAPGIDAMNHHPEWKNIYNRVEVTLCTHDAGNTVTEKDYALAALLDEVFNHFSGK